MTTSPQPPSESRLAPVAVAGGVFKQALEGILFGFGASSEERPMPVRGVLPGGGDVDTVCGYVLELIEKGCGRFMAVALHGDAAWPSAFQNHRYLRPYLDVVNSLTELYELFNQENAPKLSCSAAARYVEAILLHNQIRRFAHGSPHDVVNCFLAPARLLSQSNVEDALYQEWRGIWENFNEYVFQKGEGEPIGSLEGELRSACEDITTWLENPSAYGGEHRSQVLERLMMLLTQIRTMADQRTEVQYRSERQDRVQPLGEAGGYRLLVVDDHAASWFPVVEALHSKMMSKDAKSQKIRIEFSLDGESMAHEPGQSIFYGAYDLILLDVFLGDQKDGRKVLRKIRRDFSQLPVLLWTTSRDEEISGEATLANGILLKKTLTMERLMGSVELWLRRGRAMRVKTLPNPFFNHVIDDAGLRELAADCHEWCLRQLDSFHALDASYFRYFTDHGGRHIVKLWELLEKAIEPFLYDDETLFPKAADLSGGDEENLICQRKLEIMGMYLAVVFHEMGMFPMRVGGVVEDFSTLPKSYLNDVRVLHAPRGMALIADTTGQHWNDPRGKDLGERLHKVKKGALAFRLAALVGYHARVFTSVSLVAFLNWEAAPENGSSPKTDLEGRFRKLKTPNPTLTVNDQAFEAAFHQVAGKIEEEVARKRLQCQCALFRFVDALDVSYTRKPADFLSGNHQLPFKQYCENLKREICKDATIQGGSVLIKVRVKAPEPEKVTGIIDYVAKSTLLSGKDLRSFEVAKEKFAPEPYAREPWAIPEDGECWHMDTIRTSSPAGIHKALDAWLEKVWEVLVEKTGNSTFWKHLEDVGILEKDLNEPQLTWTGGELISSITALSVAGELLDEYQAIVESELQDKIQLCVDGWVWGESLHSEKDLIDLPSLKPFMPKLEPQES